MTRTTLRAGATRTLRSAIRRAAVAATLVALTTTGLLAAAGSASAEPLFVVTGRGYGHGIGLSQVGARGFAEHGYTYDKILTHYFQKTTIGSLGSNPAIRVALDAVDAPHGSWTVRAVDGSLSVAGDTGSAKKLPAGKYYTLVVSGTHIKVFLDVNGNGVQNLPQDTWAFDAVGKARVTAQSPTGSGSPVQVHTLSGPWSWNDVRYRGTVRVVPTGGRVLGFNDVALEDYLRGVVPRESPSYYPAEALKAQAVAARGYAWRERKSSGQFDVYPTTQSQVYNGYGRVTGSGATSLHETKSTDAAVAQTAGKVVKYGSTVVQTFFFSTSGGRTESIQNVWGGSPVPYFTSVDDPYEQVDAYHRIWAPVTFSASALRAKLKAKGLPVPGVLTDVVATKRGVSGRLVTVVLKGAAGDDKTLPLGAMDRLRSAVGGHDNWIYITKSSVKPPASVQYGVPFTARVVVSPGYTGVVALAYGPAGAASLSGKAKASLYRGGGYASFPGLTSATDIVVWNGSAGTSVLFRSPRVKVAVARRTWVGATASGRVLTISAGVRPVKTGLPVTLWVLAPGAKAWKLAGTAGLSSGGSASVKWTATSAGVWAVRAVSSAANGFVAGTSGAARVTVAK